MDNKYIDSRYVDIKMLYCKLQQLGWYIDGKRNMVFLNSLERAAYGTTISHVLYTISPADCVST